MHSSYATNACLVFFSYNDSHFSCLGRVESTSATERPPLLPRAALPRPPPPRDSCITLLFLRGHMAKGQPISLSRPWCVRGPSPRTRPPSQPPPPLLWCLWPLGTPRPQARRPRRPRPQWPHSWCSSIRRQLLPCESPEGSGSHQCPSSSHQWSLRHRVHPQGKEERTGSVPLLTNKSNDLIRFGHCSLQLAGKGFVPTIA